MPRPRELLVRDSDLDLEQLEHLHDPDFVVFDADLVVLNADLVLEHVQQLHHQRTWRTLSPRPHMERERPRHLDDLALQHLD